MSISDKFWMLVIAILIAVCFNEFISSIYKVVFAPLYGYKCKNISFFGINLKKDEDSEISFEKGKLSCKCDIVVDNTKLVPYDIEKKGMTMRVVESIVLVVVGIIMFVVTFDYFERVLSGRVYEMHEMFFGLIGISILIVALKELFSTIRLYYLFNNSLSGYTELIMKEMSSATNFEEISMKTINQLELEYKKVTESEKVKYYVVYAQYLYDKYEMEELHSVSEELYLILTKHDKYVESYKLAYYWLVYYYSEVKVDKARADCMRNKVKGILDADLEANAKRVLAYYLYMNEKYDSARDCVKEGLATVYSFSSGIERELEIKLLMCLDERLNKILKE